MVSRVNVDPSVLGVAVGDRDFGPLGTVRGEVGDDAGPDLNALLRVLGLALENLDLDADLVVHGRAEDLGRLSGERGLLLDHDQVPARAVTGDRHDAQRVTVDVADDNPAQKTDDVLGDSLFDCRRDFDDLDGLFLTGGSLSDFLLEFLGRADHQDRRPVSGPDRDALVGVDTLLALLLGHALKHRLDGRHSRRAANRNDAVELGPIDVGLLEHDVHVGLGLLEQGERQLLELVARDRELEALAAALGEDLRLGLLGERLLRLFDLDHEVLIGLRVLARVYVVLVLELLGDVIQDHVVPVLASQTALAVGREDRHVVPVDVEDRDVERAAAQVIDQRLHVAVEVVHAERDRGCGRLVQDPEHVQTSDLTRVARGLALVVVEVGRAGDHDVADLLAELILRVGHDPFENDRGQDLGGVFPLLNHAHPVRLAHVALDELNDVLGIADRLVLGDLPDDDLVILEQDHRRRDPLVVTVGDDVGLAVFIEVGDRRIGRAQVDSRNLALTLVRHSRPLFPLCSV